MGRFLGRCFGISLTQKMFFSREIFLFFFLIMVLSCEDFFLRPFWMVLLGWKISGMFGSGGFGCFFWWFEGQNL